MIDFSAHRRRQIGIVVVIWIALQLSAAVMVYAERKVAAYLQQRVGPTESVPQDSCSRSPMS